MDIPPESVISSEPKPIQEANMPKLNKNELPPEDTENTIF
jgi:hypothetical protein